MHFRENDDEIIGKKNNENEANLYYRNEKDRHFLFVNKREISERRDPSRVWCIHSWKDISN